MNSDEKAKRDAEAKELAKGMFARRADHSGAGTNNVNLARACIAQAFEFLGTWDAYISERDPKPPQPKGVIGKVERGGHD